MPNIKGIDLSDGIKILSGTISWPDAVLSKADMIINFQGKTIAQCETWANNYLATRVPNEQVKVHIFSLSPLSYTCIVANKDVTIPPNWWGT